MTNYAGFWIRVAAYLIDTIVLLVVQWLVFAAFGVSALGVNSLDPAAGDMFATTGGIIAYLVTTVGAIAYFVVMESSSKLSSI